MLNVFTLDNGRLKGGLFQEEIESAEELAKARPIWVDLEAPPPKKKAGSATASGSPSPRTSWTKTWKSPPASTRRTTVSCTSAPTS